ncbi:MAG: ABC transporter permease [Planctomycetia bacterium]|nr:ABC transporter permease [Planctomycetia bacterium]
MSLWKMAWRSIQQRGTASALTMLSMALGVALIVAVMVVYGVVDQSFRNTASGYELIVGAKGGSLQLTLNTVYHIGRPIENIPWTYYKEFKPGGTYASLVESAIPYCMGDNYEGYRVVATTPEMFTTLEYAQGKPYEFSAGRNFGAEAAHAAGEPDDGHGHAHDSHSHAGHDHAAHDHGPAKPVASATATAPWKPRTVAIDDDDIVHEHAHEGHDHHAPPHFNEAVIGSIVARNTGLKVGSTFQPTHGITTEAEQGHQHDPITVVGILRPTGTPNDQAIFMNIEGFFLLEGHSKSGEHHHDGPLPEEDREVTAILIKTSPDHPTAGITLKNVINEGQIAQAALPLLEVATLFKMIVRPVMIVLLLVAVMIVIVAGIGIIVSIYNSMNERRREIAIMRSLGAGRSTVLAVVMLESLLLALCGGIGGFLLGHLLVGLSSPYLVAQTGVELGFLQFPTFEIPLESGALIVPIELVLLPGLILLAGLVGYFPARAAYKTDVSRALSNSN